MTEGNEEEVTQETGFVDMDPSEWPEFIQTVLVWYVVIIPVSALGNLLCLLVVTRKQNRSISCSVYMAALSVADTVVLLSQGCFLTANIALSDVLPEVQHIAACKTCVYTMYSAAFGNVLIILALLVERVVVVTWPLKAAVHFSPKSALVVVVIVSVITLLYNVPVIISTWYNGVCVAVPESGLFSYVYQMSKVVLGGIVPFVGILVMNIAILWAVKKSHKKKINLTREAPVTNEGVGTQSESVDMNEGVDQNEGVNENEGEDVDQTEGVNENEGVNEDEDVSHNEGVTEIEGPEGPQSQSCPKVDDIRIWLADYQDRQMRKRERQLTVMMVVMSLAFLCLTVPKYALLLNTNEGRREVTVGARLGALITQMLFILNSAVNILLYVVSGSKFRKDLVNLFRCPKARRGGGGIEEPNATD